jgi:hypothetical protein
VLLLLLAMAASCGDSKGQGGSLPGAASSPRSDAIVTPYTASITASSGPSSSAPRGISPEEAAALEPLAPSDVAVEVAHDGIMVSWRSTNEDASFFVCQRRPAGTTTSENLARVPADAQAPTHQFLDKTAVVGQPYEYGVAVESTFGRLSAVTWSETVTRL